jgi:predicted nucleotide-binding protein
MKMGDLQALLDEWASKVHSTQISDDDHLEWSVTIKQALRSVNSDLFSDFQPETAIIRWETDEEEAYQKCILADIREIRAIIKASERFPATQSSAKKVSEFLEASRSVFIVHGHDDAVRETVARFIEKLGIDPIILFERPNGGKTIIEKFEKEADVGFAIALLTSDDTAICKRDQKKETRARQNVVFELGYFAAKLGRERVAVLKQAGVAEPSDLHGIVYTELDGKGAWKVELAKELRAAGFEIDMNKAF